jgi:hypothetical protein
LDDPIPDRSSLAVSRRFGSPQSFVDAAALMGVPPGALSVICRNNPVGLRDPWGLEEKEGLGVVASYPTSQDAYGLLTEPSQTRLNALNRCLILLRVNATYRDGAVVVDTTIERPQSFRDPQANFIRNDALA